MEAPDADELLWMVEQGSLPNEDEDDDFFFEDPPPPFKQGNDAPKLLNIPENGPKRQFENGYAADQTGDLDLDFDRTGIKRSRKDDDFCYDSGGKQGKGFRGGEEEESSSMLNTEEVMMDETGMRVQDNDFFSIKKCKLPRKRATDIEGEIIPITGPSGERVYAEIQTSSSNSSHVLHNTPPRTGLLSEPIDVLIEKLEQEILHQACLASTTDKSAELSISSTTTTHEQLWVEKYSPKSFTELLSDEQTNREVLRWLKQWDSIVFGEKKTSTSTETLAALHRHVPASQGRGHFSGRGNGGRGRNGSFRENSKPALNNESVRQTDGLESKKFSADFSKDEQGGRNEPDAKILLLCGPPGLGKTTLAHVAAKHCGYRVVEINASDDRVAATLQAKILDAIQMKSVMGDCRPNCLVIDEIDGALNGSEGKGAIDVLLNIVNSEKKSAHGKDKENDGLVKKTSMKKASSKTNRLSRPIICICNDLYAPALRSLRQAARVHVFAQPSNTRVVTRLKYICNMEGYKANARALTALAEYTDCDIRSCLNTLQFLQKKKEPLKMLDISSQVVGRKDMTSSIFDVWGEIFQKKKPRPSFAQNPALSSKNSDPENKDFIRVHDLIANHGDNELIVEGIHENVLHIRYQDSSLQKTVMCLECLGDSEIISHRALHNQYFGLFGYLPSFALSIRHLVAQPERANLEWPKTSQRYRTEVVIKEELLRFWMSSMVPTVSRTLSANCLTLDVVSLFLHILSPQTLRPVAPQLLSPTEKLEISQLVDTMIGYGINYKPAKVIPAFQEIQETAFELQGLVLDPPINKLVKFKGYTPGFRFLSSTLRQVLSHEVEIESIRRESCARSARAAAAAVDLQALSISDHPPPCASPPNPPKEEATDKSKDFNSMKMGKLNPQNEDQKSITQNQNQKRPVASAKQPANFFERFKRNANKQCGIEKDVNIDSATLKRDSRPLLYKFHEGFTNAVRRPMLIREFL